MIRTALLAAGLSLATTLSLASDAFAQSRTSTAGQSYQSRSYQQNSSANRQSAAASRAFAPAKSRK